MFRTALLALSFLLAAGALPAQHKPQAFLREADLVTTGIYYYPEHWPETQWERDISNIAKLGYEFVHLAEFAWYKMEPKEGVYEFGWLDKVVNLCEKYGLKVLLCTPSATTPTWMRVNYPETFVMDGHYIRAENGTRGLASIVNPRFRSYVERIVRELARRYGKHKNVMGWQLDNEPGALQDYSPSSQEAFRTWLKNKYKTVDALNQAWGTAFWSQWFSSFNEVIIPNTNLVGWWGNNPHALLDFKRYTADAQAEFLDFQAEILRNNVVKEQFITTNYMAITTGADAMRTRKLDFATYTAYPNGGSANLGPQGFRLGNGKLILFAADYFKSLGGLTGVLEMQPGPVNWGSYNPLLLPGAVRMWLYHSFAAGGRLACSYRYRQITYGAEQYHSGITKTDGVTLSPGGEEYVQFMQEIKSLRAKFTPGTAMPEKLKNRSTAIVWNLENYWSLERQKQTHQWDTWNYPVKFLEIAKSFGAPVDIVQETADLSAYKVVLVPAYEMADAALIGKWTEYVKNGGHLVLTCRTATKNRMGHFWEAETAQPLTALIGAHIQATDMLSPYSNAEVTMGERKFRWNNWADILVPEKGTEGLATYAEPFYKGKNAVVQRSIGKGTVTYIGVDTDDAALEKEVLRMIYQKVGATTENYPEGVYVYWRDGFYIAVNYSSGNYPIDIPSGSNLLVGEKILKPADVTVWRE